MGQRKPRPVDKITLFHPALATCFSFCLHKAAARLKTSIDHVFAGDQLVGPQFAILTILKKRGHQTQIELGRALLMDRATMVKLLDGLEKKKLIIRNADRNDRRVNRISVSKRGLARLEVLNRERLRIERSFLKILAPGERKRLARMVFQLASAPLLRK